MRPDKNPARDSLRELVEWTKLRDQIRREWDKRQRPVIVFPSKETKIAWLAEGLRTGVTPPLPEGAYYESDTQS